MVAIQTKYLGPTNYRGSRVKAFTETKLSVTINWDDAKDVAENHMDAANALAEKYGWTGSWRGGSTETGYAFVCTTRMGVQFDVGGEED